MFEAPTKYGVIVAVDGSAESDAAVSWAAREVSLRHENVTLMHVVQPVALSWPVTPEQTTFAEWQEDNARHVIDQACDRLCADMHQPHPPGYETAVLHAHPVEALADASRDASMIVVGSHGRGAFGRLLLGSVSRGLVEHVHCPVAVVHSEEASTPIDPKAPVLLGVDGSPASEAATEWAFDEASRRGVELIALHAWSDIAVFPILGMDWRTYQGQGEELLAERLAGWQERYPDVRVSRRLVCDTPRRWLIEESHRVQLVVLGRRGRGGFTGLRLGGVSAAVARSARVPVIVVPTSSENVVGPVAVAL